MVTKLPPKIETKIPPATEAMTPEIGGASHAIARPKLSGKAIKLTTSPENKYLGMLFRAVDMICLFFI